MKSDCVDKEFKAMYRYLLKFVGTYRVKAELDLITHDFPRNASGEIDESFEDLYIPCARGVIKHTYLGRDILALCYYNHAQQARNIYTILKEKYPKIDIELDDGDTDGLIYFNAKDIKKIATVCQPRTSGKDISPFSPKNLPKAEYQIPSKDLQELYEITKSLDRLSTMHFFKQINQEFMKSLGKKMQTAKLQSRLSTKEFVHSAGLWDKYVKYAKKRYSNFNA